MKRFIRFVIMGWGSISNFDEPTPAPTILARWRQWRGRGEWPGSFARELKASWEQGFEDARRDIEKSRALNARIDAKYGRPPKTQ